MINVAQIIIKASSARYVGGSEVNFVSISSTAVKGSDISVEKRNVHFINVMTEYLLIRGLKMPR